MFFAAIALATIALSAASTQERLIASNIHNDYDVQKLCQSARREKYLNQEVTAYENEVSPFGGFESHKIRSKVNDCCVRPSNFAKKQCLKNVRKYYLDTKCDKGINHVCCQTPGPQRYVCFSKNPFTTLPYNVEQAENDEQFSYLENVEDVLAQNAYGFYPQENFAAYESAQYEADSFQEDDYENENELVNAVQCQKFGQNCKCANSNQCRHKLEKATHWAAKQTCAKNQLKGGRNAAQTCCEAGNVVGATVGKRHSKVCVPALYKFQSKVQGCGVNHKPQCKNAFVQCCKQAKLNSNSFEYDYENPAELASETYQELVNQAVQYPFNN